MYDRQFAINIVNKLDRAIDLTKDVFIQADIQERLQCISESNHAGEWRIAFEFLCDNLYEFDLPIFQQTYELLTEISNILKMDKKEWEVLKLQIF